ncbi:SDR family NAD(P)-dependent oxidoreductase [Microbacterium sp. No. 7]|uniref:SDR family NAD(P)-dependent oxidoreductase n=1 Tax=Microbacterium sp. No. 7 TaxID=1714373 RepID=UPI0006D1DFA5|nr:SDR family NAD(P)-dependent oxidoreductase [Microbacterium sp. No. 7]ALJ20684.1 3-hydroxy-2-methylbutyryl-CoA dehydrogenase [Microbacterium sp. No. 7]
MEISAASAIVTGGASGLGLATARRIARRGAHVVILDLPTSEGAAIAEELGGSFAPADVRDSEAVAHAVQAAAAIAPLRILVHCAGRGGGVRVVDRDGEPGDQKLFDEIVSINLMGTFNVLRLVAAQMVTNDPIDGERGVCVLTASVAAWEGQISQTPYSASKAGVVGMTIVAARDLASRLVRVNTIAPGLFETPILARFSPETLNGIAAQVPHPARLGRPDEFAALADHIIDNPMVNGETIRLDGAIRMGPR